MPRATAISAGEAKLLRQAIEDKFLKECTHVQELKQNSYKESYRDLSNHMALVVVSHKDEFSVTRLRKLFYYTNPSKNGEDKLPSFGEMFIEGCYLYISDGEKNREAYLNRVSQPKPKQGKDEIVSELTATKSKKPALKAGLSKFSWVNWKFVKGLLLGIVLGFLLGQDPRSVWWLTRQDHTWWICEYENGTLVYNNFRSYRTQEEVRSYFNGETKGDCDSFRLKKNSDKGKRIAMCFDAVNAKRYQKNHGPIVKVYRER